MWMRLLTWPRINFYVLVIRVEVSVTYVAGTFYIYSKILFMYKYFVYIETVTNRLCIVTEPIHNSSFKMLMNNNGNDSVFCLSLCKHFCLGYMVGCNKVLPVNDMNEFI